MSARDDIEHFHAWAKIVFGHLWSDDPPPDYAKIQQEVARLLGSGKPIPPFAEKWLADLRTPRRPGQGREVHADFRPDCRGAQVLRRERREYLDALKILDLLQTGMSINKAIARIFPGRVRRGWKAWASAKRFMHPWLVARLPRNKYRTNGKFLKSRQ
jgi:hypothetical protein